MISRLDKKEKKRSILIEENKVGGLRKY